MWEQASGMTAALSDARVERITSGGGLPAITLEQGMAMFDAATASDEALVVAIPLSPGSARIVGEVPALLRGLVRSSRKAATDGAEVTVAMLQDRLHSLEPAEQEDVLLKLVVDYAATILGHADSEAVHPTRDFLESGFDSLTAIELRNKLAEAVGMRLPSTVVFETRQPAQLARWLHNEMLTQGKLGSAPSSAAATATKTAVSSGSAAEDTIGSLFVAAVKSGKIQEGMAIVAAVGAARPTFETSAELETPPVAVILADGPTRPRLICISSPVLTGGVHQYARIAGHFRGKRRVCALPLVGFEMGESLPATPEAAMRVIAESVLEASDGEPFVLVGHSSAGALALSVAGLLEHTWGTRAEAVVMLDTLTLHTDGGEDKNFDDFGRFAMTQADTNQSVVLNSARLSAMAHWLNTMSNLVMHPITAPTLLVRAGVLVPGLEVGDRSSIRADTVRMIDADHFSLAMEDSAVTAQMIEEWLGTVEVVLS
jgi:pimeloyl-ACP methyl ester carboxylesterase